MANEEHLGILGQGATTWNEWRGAHKEIHPDLYGADLSGADLSFSNFNKANLFRAKLCGANLTWASFGNTDLMNANFVNANLSNSNFSNADFTFSFLRGADVSAAYLRGATFSDADLREANLRDAILFGATFRSGDIRGAKVDGAMTKGTEFIDIDLSEVEGLENVVHVGPSEISFSTIYRSEGQIPEVFLRGCGMPESFIVQIPALVAAMQPIQFYSCFISYSSKDQKFAARLHADLQAKGVRCWYAQHDLKIGEKIRIGIDESIRVHDKLLLILSKNSIESEWVEKEVETALERERQQKRTILFPIRLDDTVLKVESGWAADVRRSRNIGDFRRWKSHDTYSKAFERLIRDLQAST